MLITLSPNLFGQANPALGDGAGIVEDDLNIGGDIFTDFNEDLEATQIIEDERFYRYGRFYSFQIGLGLTAFDGNRGSAYENDPPTFQLGIAYFLDFNSSFVMGLEYSKHHMFIDQAVNGSRNLSSTDSGFGLIDVAMLRAYWGYRYYIDTANLGTAITYSNPYLTGRVEYWYVVNKFRDQPSIDDDTGGGLGFGLGFGLEFPIRIKESYINAEFLFHTVNFHDKFTQDFRPIEGSDFGFDDLTGNVYTTIVAYVISY